MATITTTQVHCPQLVCAGCGGEAVTAKYGAKSVAVTPCQSLLAQGWTGDQVVLWHNQALELLTPVAQAVAQRHADGLVAFA